MTRHRLLLVVLMFGLGAALTTASSPQADLEIASIAPNPASPSPSPQWLTVGGHGFMAHVAVSITTPSGAVWHSRESDVADVRDTSFRVSVVLSGAGAYQVVATNPDGRASRASTLSVKVAAAAPTVSGVTPGDISKSPNSQVLSVEGAHFVAGLSAMVTDPAGTVSTISGSGIGQVSANAFQMTVTLELEGGYEVTVTNPSGSVSSAFAFKVNGIRQPAEELGMKTTPPKTVKAVRGTRQRVCN